MKIKFNEKYNTIAAYTIFVFAVCLLLCMFAFRIEIFRDAFSKLIQVSSPILWGLVIAYLLNPLVTTMEGWFSFLFSRKKEHPRLVRGLSVGCSILLLFALLICLIASVIPEIINNIRSLSDKFQDPYFLSSVELRIRSVFSDMTDKTAFLSETLKLNFDTIQKFLLTLMDKLELGSSKLFSKDGLLSGVTSGLLGILDAVKNAVLGLIVSIYLLSSKERFQAQSKKLITAMLSESNAKTLFALAHEADQKFIGYFTGVALDCFIIFIVSFAFLMIMKMPYALLISIILALTNAIPVFGPYIGSIPSFLLLLMFSPVKAVIFLIFTIVLQQIDGNIIAPFILGDKLGLSGFWILCAVFIGGGLFGIAGMIVASPVFAVLYSICSTLTVHRLKAKGKPGDTEAYMKQKPSRPVPAPQAAAIPETETEKSEEISNEAEHHSTEK